MVIYSIDQETVEPVFFPVVPDSFMRRGGDAAKRLYAAPDNGFAEAIDSPMVSPHDPWSF